MTKVHLDTDLGGDFDDLCALALLLKWPDVDITGITIVTDDKGIRAGYTKYALDLAGRCDIPLKAGADVSLGRYRIKCGYQDTRYWPGSLPQVNNTLDETLKLLKKSIEQGSTIICIGPYTNLYLLDKKYPGILERANIVLMGGYIYPPSDGYPQWKQNYDFNIQVDVESSKHVLEHSSPTLVPLTVTIETYIRRGYIKRLKSSDPLNRLIAKQAEIFAVDEGYEEKFGKTCEKLPDDLINFQHDSLAVAVALGWSEGIEIKTLPLSFSVKDTWLNQTIDPKSHRTYSVVTKIDGDRFSKFWLKRVLS